MSKWSAIEKATANFYAWEERGRGWRTFADPVQLEPVYVPFFPYKEESFEIKDDAKIPTIPSRIVSFLGRLTEGKRKNNEPSYTDVLEQLYEQNAYIFSEDEPLVGFTILFAEGCSLHPESFIQFLIMLSDSEYPISFEIIGEEKKITIQIVCRDRDAFRLNSQLQAYWSDAIILENRDIILNIINSELRVRTIDLGLFNECTIPIEQFGKKKVEHFKSLFGLLDFVRANERIVLQVLFQGVLNPWSRSILNSLTSRDGTCFFMDAPEMLDLATEKTASPLFSVVVRVAAQAQTLEQTERLLEESIACINAQSNSGANQLIPLRSENDNSTINVSDFISRRSHRLGMLLNTGELATFVHYPDSAITSLKLNQKHQKTKQAPKSLVGHPYVIGENRHLDSIQQVSLDISTRLKHMHIIGATGTGKSTLLTNLISQDIHSGYGIALLDPHGDLVEDVLGLIPENRIKDVVVVDPSDIEFPIGLNLLRAKTEIEKIVLSSDLVAGIRRQSTSWGDQMTAILGNAINAFLESEKGGTLFDLRRFLLEDSFRKQFLKTIEDPTITQFWQHEYVMLRKAAIAPILIRLDTFLRPKIIRNMMAQREGLDFTELLNSNKIILVKLAQGLIGEENSYLLGTLIVAKIQQAAQARQSIPHGDRKPFFLYLDEFQNFITPSMSAILSGSRKYGLGLILAHQDMEQVNKQNSELAYSILSNPATRICFRVGDHDARQLERGFSYFDANDLQNLHVGSAIAKVETNTQDFNVSTYLKPSFELEKYVREQCISESRNTYANSRTFVEQQIFEMYGNASKESVVLNPVEQHPINLKPEITEHINSNIEEQKAEFIKKKEEVDSISEHRRLQAVIKKMAENHGFKAVIEEPINNGEGRVDIGLTKDLLRIAVEVSITNTNSYELGNIVKCLDAGYSPVIMCSPNDKHLRDIQSRVLNELHTDRTQHVLFHSPEQLFSHLSTLTLSEEPAVQRIKGYRVKVSYGNK